MKSDVVALYAIVILLFPMGYFLFASVSFLFVRLGSPDVSILLRGLLNAYFLMLAIASLIATVALAVSGHLVFAVCTALLGSLAIVARHWLLRRVDAQRSAREAGNHDAIRHFRWVHLAVMGTNFVQFVAVLGAVPFIM